MAPNGPTALMLAAQNGHEQVARALIEAGAQINAAANNGFTALMLSCQNGHEQVARALLENGAAVNSQENEGWTALMWAAQNGHDQVRCSQSEYVDLAADSCYVLDFTPSLHTVLSRSPGHCSRMEQLSIHRTTRAGLR